MNRRRTLSAHGLPEKPTALPWDGVELKSPALTPICSTSIIQRQNFKERPMANANVKEFTDQNFDAEVLKSAQPVLVDFWAEWCMPCRMLAPTIEKLADNYAGKVKVGKVDTDSNRDTAMKYGIRG